MMKKLLVLSLVLGVASLASAGYYFTTIAPEMAAPGESFNVTINVGSALALANLQSPVITVTGGTITSATMADVFKDGTSPSFSWDAGQASASDLLIDPAIATGTTLFTFTITQGTGTVVDATSGTWAGFNAVVGPVDGYLVGGELFDDQSGLPYAQIAVPEPATMALLGLGALVLRRKK